MLAGGPGGSARIVVQPPAPGRRIRAERATPRPEPFIVLWPAGASPRDGQTSRAAAVPAISAHSTRMRRRWPGSLPAVARTASRRIRVAEDRIGARSGHTSRPATASGGGEPRGGGESRRVYKTIRPHQSLGSRRRPNTWPPSGSRCHGRTGRVQHVDAPRSGGYAPVIPPRPALRSDSARSPARVTGHPEGTRSPCPNSVPISDHGTAGLAAGPRWRRERP
jgi:hypothetical protein